jgi:hypothetical protein
MMKQWLSFLSVIKKTDLSKQWGESQSSGNRYPLNINLEK